MDQEHLDSLAESERLYWVARTMFSLCHPQTEVLLKMDEMVHCLATKTPSAQFLFPGRIS
jgi:hypothetical protein